MEIHLVVPFESELYPKNKNIYRKYMDGLSNAALRKYKLASNASLCLGPVTVEDFFDGHIINPFNNISMMIQVLPLPFALQPTPQLINRCGVDPEGIYQKALGNSILALNGGNKGKEYLAGKPAFHFCYLTALLPDLLNNFWNRRPVF